MTNPTPEVELIARLRDDDTDPVMLRQAADLITALIEERAGQSHADAGLLAALEPFAKALGKAADDPRWADDDTIEYDGFAEFITVGDLRRARAAIAALGAGGRDAG